MTHALPISLDSLLAQAHTQTMGVSFVNPTLAAVGIACVAVPIIIHIIMRRKRRPVQWGAMKFLMEAYRRQRRRTNLEQVLLLLTRCLLVACLALAVGRPLLGALASRATGPTMLYIVIDDSLTSGVQIDGAGTTELEASKSRALELIAQLDQSRGDKVALITLSGPASGVILPPSTEHGAVVSAIKQLAPTASHADLSGGLTLVRDTIRNASTAETSASRAAASPITQVALLSGWRAGSADLTAALPAISTALVEEGNAASAPGILLLPPATQPAENIAITELEPLRKLVVTSKGQGSEDSPASTPVRVTLRRSSAGSTASSASALPAAISKITVTAVPLGSKGPLTTAAPASSARAETSINWAAGQESATAFVTVDVRAPRTQDGALRDVLLVASIDRDAIPTDSVFTRPIDTRQRLDVAILEPAAAGTPATIASFRAADWLALAFSPQADRTLIRRQGGEVRLTNLDPGALSDGPATGEGALAGMDAVIVTRPDLLNASDWVRVRRALDRGAMVLVCPPADATTHLWTDGFTQAMGLTWTIAREPITRDKPVSIEISRSESEGLFGLIAAELGELAKPVTVTKSLPIDATDDATRVLLRTADGAPVLLRTQLGSGKPVTGNAPAPSSRGVLLVFGCPPDLAWTDLPAKPLMVPLMQELLRQGVGQSVGERLAVAGTEISSHAPVGTTLLAPLIGEPLPGSERPTLTLNGEVVSTGNIDRSVGVWASRDATGEPLGVVAVNADTRASDVSLLQPEDLLRWLQPVASNVRLLGAQTATADGSSAITAPASRDSSTKWSMWLLAAAAVLGLLELIMARVWSHANRDAFTAGVGTLSESTTAAKSVEVSR